MQISLYNKKFNYVLFMNNEQKGIAYGKLMIEHTKLQNKMAEIQGSSINLTREQLMEIDDIKKRMFYIYNLASRL